MVTKSKLRMALAAEKGVDFKKLKEKRKAKARKKAEQQKRGADSSDEEQEEKEVEAVDEDEESEDEEGDEEFGNGVNLDGIDDSDTSDSSVDMEERIPRKAKAANGTQEDSDDEEEEEEEDDIPVSDLEDLDDEDKEDLIPHTRLTINNTSALLAALNRIALPTDPSTVPFATHQTVISAEPTADSIPDVSDDLQRELAFYSQSLDAVRRGRAKLRAEGVPFSRPKDYFAEMLKEDAHMEKVKAKLVEEASAKKAAAEARKLRDLKKFGKQVQVAKLQERQKQKRETLEKIKTLKRKRQESGGDVGATEADLFDVAVDKELAGYNKSNKSSDRSGPGRGGPNAKRQKKNEKYGFGGKKRHAKSGDAVSSSDLSGFDPKKMKAKGRVSKTRPGKSRRQAMAGR